MHLVFQLAVPCSISASFTKSALQKSVCWVGSPNNVGDLLGLLDDTVSPSLPDKSGCLSVHALRRSMGNARFHALYIHIADSMGVTECRRSRNES